MVGHSSGFSSHSPWLAPSETIARIAVAVLLLVVATAFGISSPGDLLVGMLAYWATVAVHEAEHAMMSLAVGHRVIELRVGMGPTLRFHLGGPRLLFGPVPGFGYVMSLSDDARGIA